MGRKREEIACWKLACVGWEGDEKGKEERLELSANIIAGRYWKSLLFYDIAPGIMAATKIQAIDPILSATY